MPLASTARKKDLPKFHIPIWLDEQCDLVRDLARRGLSTVIELPLRDHSATDVARRKIDELEGNRSIVTAVTAP